MNEQYDSGGHLFWSHTLLVFFFQACDTKHVYVVVESTLSCPGLDYPGSPYIGTY